MEIKVNTISAIIQRIQSEYSKGVQSDDSRLRPRHIYHKMLTVRAKLLRQKLNKRQLINDWNYTVLPCVKFIKVDAHECPCLPQIDCKVYRTEHPIPKPLVDLSKHEIQWMYTLNNIKIDFISREGYENISGNRYTSDSTKAIIENQHIYLYGKNIPKVAKIKFLPEDVTEALNYPSYCEEDCVDCEEDCKPFYDNIFPMDSDTIEDLITYSSKELVDDFRVNPEDISNNTRDTEFQNTK